MSGAITVVCGACLRPVQAGDRFCEACGARCAAAPTDRHEIDAGLAAGVSDRGRVRRRNEDAIRLGVEARHAFAVVCDGVATSAAGDAASAAGADAAASALRAGLDGPAPTEGHDREAMMQAAIAAAQDAVTRVPWTPGDDRGAPASTLVAVTWDGRHLTVGSVGDSRAYWLGLSGARQLTVDDSFGREQVDGGHATEEEAAAMPDAHALTRWLGVDAPDRPYRVGSLRIDEPGLVVCCTDGLWHYAPRPQDLLHLVGSRPGVGHPLAVAVRLADAAIDAGGHDNVTVAVIAAVPGTAPTRGVER